MPTIRAFELSQRAIGDELCIDVPVSGSQRRPETCRVSGTVARLICLEDEVLVAFRGIAPGPFQQQVAFGENYFSLRPEAIVQLGPRELMTPIATSQDSR
jgi:hypothetical protein